MAEATQRRPLFSWLFGERLGVKEPAGCIGSQVWACLTEIGRERTDSASNSDAFAVE